MNTNQIKYLTGVSIMASLTVLFIVIGNIPIGIFTITLALIPIVIGSILYGKWAGLLLGLLMGFVYLLNGSAAPFLAVAPFGTVVLMLAKSGLAGFISGLAYELISKKNQHLGIWVSSLVAPIINTGLFILLTFIFLNGMITENSGGTNPIYYIATAYVGINFFVEFGISIVLAPIITYLVKIVRKDFKEPRG